MRVTEIESERLVTYYYIHITFVYFILTRPRHGEENADVVEIEYSRDREFSEVGHTILFTYNFCLLFQYPLKFSLRLRIVPR